MLNDTPVNEQDQCLLLYTACIADTILQPLFQFVQRRGLFGYIDTLREIVGWAARFHNAYQQHLSDWDEFEESELNIYNSRSWDEFLTCWANDRLKEFETQHGKRPNPLTHGNLHFSGAKATRLIIVIKAGQLSAVYSNREVQVAHLISSNSEPIPFHAIEFFNADTLADKLYTLFDAADPNQSSVRELLRKHGF